MAALDELSTVDTSAQLLHKCHLMWCGSLCARNTSCSFLHYPRSDPPPAAARAIRPRYNKDTARLYNVMGGQGYVPGTLQMHEENAWPLLQAVLERADSGRGHNGLLFCDYTDWSKKSHSTANRLVRSVYRDVLQWMGSWCGADYANSTVALHYLAFSTIADDICIPPLDMVQGRLRMYGLSVLDVVRIMESEGWDRDATHLVLSLVRQYLVQYAEKVDPGIGIHAAFGRCGSVWDSAVYRSHTANAYGAAILVGRITGSGPVTSTWLCDAALCDAMSLDLAKSALQVYKQDDFMPTKSGAGMHKQRARALERQRQAAYQSLYLDLIDDLVSSGAPDSIVNFGRAGFHYVPICDRYLERLRGRRFPISPAIEGELLNLFGDEPTDPRLDGLFRLRQLARWPESEAKTSANRPPRLSPALLTACHERQQRRRQAYYSEGAPDSARPSLEVQENSLGCNSARGWINRVHSLAAEAASPGDLHSLLRKMMSFDGGQLESMGSLDNIWALCVSCQLDCGADCEWLAFAYHSWNQLLATHSG